MSKRNCTFTLSEEVIHLLNKSTNKSDYIERVILAFPPPRCSNLAELSVLIVDAHPWVMDRNGMLPRSDLPRFGGDVPSRPANAVSWDDQSVLDYRGTIVPRKEWESA